MSYLRHVAQFIFRMGFNISALEHDRKIKFSHYVHMTPTSEIYLLL